MSLAHIIDDELCRFELKAALPTMQRRRLFFVQSLKDKANEVQKRSKATSKWRETEDPKSEPKSTKITVATTHYLLPDSSYPSE